MNYRALIALTTGHFVGDSYGSFLAPLLPLLIVRHDLDLKQAGLLAAVLSISSQLTQPAWGYLADRWPGRRFAIAGPLIMAVCISAIGLAPTVAVLVLALACGGSGMAAFHPEAASLARQASGSRAALGLSLFISGGNLGFAFGPVVVTALVAAFGLPGTAWGVVPGLIGFLVLLKLVPRRREVAREDRSTSPAARATSRGPSAMVPLLNLCTISILRGIVTVSFVTFLPVLFASRGVELWRGGQFVTVFLLAGAVGGVTGGYAAERFGNKRVMGVTLMLAAPVLWAAIWTTGPWQAVALFMGGALLVASHPVSVSLAQSLAPHRAGTVAAFMIGVAMGLAGLLMPLVGALADARGVDVGLAVMVLASVLAALLVIPLPAAASREVQVVPA
jgi:FSR family fosmidomycin resistance protein-like MFS transporter